MKGLIDIGAHYAEEFFFIHPSDRMDYNYIFFEPVKSTFDKMCEILPKSNKIKTYNIALGNTTGSVVMNIETANKGQSSSILRPKIHLRQYPHIKFIGKETVKIDKLDNIEYDRSLYDVVHIDVQGYELEVLKGAEKSLTFINELTVEVNKEELYEGCPMVGEIDNFLKPFGFVRITTDWIGNNWGDASYRKIH